MWKDRTIGWCHDEENIKGFFDEYRYLSNFHVCDVMFEGVIYPSSENAYMAAKTTDLEKRKDFLGIKPREAKELGMKIELRKDWDSIKFDIMHNILLDKFTRNEALKEMLLSTDDKFLEETNYWGDVIWGVCNGVGQNNLGLTLMKVRGYLKTQ